MKKTIIYAAVWALVCGCSGTNQGELVGVERSAQFYEPDPYGMVYVPQGSFNMGQNEQDVASQTTAMTKTVTVQSFWMDDTEITNSEYRQFVGWVRDSIARELLANGVDEEFHITEDKAGNELDKPLLNWKKEIEWKNPDYQEVLNEMYYAEDERFFGRKEFDTRKWTYEYDWVDLQQAAKLENRYVYNIEEKAGKYHGKVYDINGEERDLEEANRSAFIMHDVVMVYPDTLCWIENFTYSYNEPQARMYFWHPGYDTYPVVGVSWKQATAFCIWRSNLLNNYLQSEGQPLAMDYRLPTEAEWEYASRGGLQQGVYPWGGYYTRNNRGCFVANFKPLRGRYTDDGSVKTASVSSYAPNEYGLFDMAGNVSEWTSSAFDESAYVYTHDMNPDYKYNARPDDPIVMKRKVLRGGSWKDVAYYLQCGTRTYEYQDSTASYIGFRCVRDYIGE